MFDLGSIKVSFDSSGIEQGTQKASQALDSFERTVAETGGALSGLRAEQDAVGKGQKAMAVALLNAKGDLERAGREQARALTKGLRDTFAQQTNAIKEGQLRGLLSPQEARARGRAAAEAFNQGLVRIIDQQGVSGNRNPLAGSLLTGLTNQAKRIKDIERAAAPATQSVNKLTSAFTSLAASEIGVKAGLGGILSTLSTLAIGSGVTLGIVAGLAAITAAFNAIAGAARKSKQETQKQIDELQQLRDEINPLGALARRANESAAAVRAEEATIARLRSAQELIIAMSATARPGQGPLVDLTSAIGAAEEKLNRLRETDALLQNRLQQAGAEMFRRFEEERLEAIEKRVRAEKAALAERLRGERELAAAQMALAQAEADLFGETIALRNLQVDRLIAEAKQAGEVVARAAKTQKEIELVLARTSRIVNALDARRPDTIIARAGLDALTPRVQITPGLGLDGTPRTLPPGLVQADLTEDIEKERLARERSARALQDTTFQLIAFGQAIAQITGSQTLGRAFGGAAQGAALGSVLPGIGTVVGAGVGFLGGLFGGGGPSAADRRAARERVQGFTERLNQRLDPNPLRDALAKLKKEFDSLLEGAIKLKVPSSDLAAAYRALQRETARLKEEFAKAEAATRGSIEAERLSLSGQGDAAARLELQLRNQAELEDLRAQGLSVTTTLLFEQVAALREEALARAQGIASIQKASQERVALLSLEAREAGLQNRTQDRVRLEAEALRAQQLGEAEAALAAGEITMEFFTRLTAVINGEFAQAMDAARKSFADQADQARKAAEALRAANEQESQNLDVRILRATGRTTEADDLERQLTRAREIEALRGRGVSEDVVSKALLAQTLEERARITGIGADSEATRLPAVGGINVRQTTETTSLRIDDRLFTLVLLVRDIRDIARAVQAQGGNVRVSASGTSTGAGLSGQDIARLVDQQSSINLAVTNGAAGVRVVA